MIDRTGSVGPPSFPGGNNNQVNQDLTTLQQLEKTLQKLQGEKEQLEEKIQQALQQAKDKVHNKMAQSALQEGSDQVQAANTPEQILAAAMAAVSNAQQHVT